MEDPVIGPVRQQAPFPRFGSEPPAAPAGAPRLGEHTDEVLSSLAWPVRYGDRRPPDRPGDLTDTSP